MFTSGVPVRALGAVQGSVRLLRPYTDLYGTSRRLVVLDRVMPITVVQGYSCRPVRRPVVGGAPSNVGDGHRVFSSDSVTVPVPQPLQFR